MFALLSITNVLPTISVSPRDTFARIRDVCATEGGPENLLRELPKAILSFQFDLDDEMSCFSVFNGHKGGLGSQIHALSNRLLLALYRGAPLLMNATTNYTSSGRYEDIWRPIGRDYSSFIRSSNREGDANACMFKAPEQCFWEAFERSEEKPPTRTFMELLSSVAVRFVTRPSECVRTILQGALARLELENLRTLAVHIRRTDKKEGVQHSNEKFVRRIGMLLRRGRYDQVLVGSDDGAIFDKLRTRIPFVRFVRVEDLLNTSCGIITPGSTTAHDTGTLLTIQSMTMARCHGFLGTLSSNLGRLVYELQWRGSSSKQRALTRDFYDMDGLHYFPCPFAYNAPWGANWRGRTKLGPWDVWDVRNESIVTPRDSPREMRSGVYAGQL
eukprot:g1303.t1